MEISQNVAAGLTLHFDRSMTTDDLTTENADGTEGRRRSYPWNPCNPWFISGCVAVVLVAITHNLLLTYEQTLETEHGVTNQAEDQRRAKRTKAAAKKCAAAGQLLSTLVLQARRATQRSVKFVRWVRQSIRDQAAEAAAVLRLKVLYATL